MAVLRQRRGAGRPERHGRVERREGCAAHGCDAGRCLVGRQHRDAIGHDRVDGAGRRCARLRRCGQFRERGVRRGSRQPVCRRRHVDSLGQSQQLGRRGLWPHRIQGVDHFRVGRQWRRLEPRAGQRRAKPDLRSRLRHHGGSLGHTRRQHHAGQLATGGCGVRQQFVGADARDLHQRRGAGADGHVDPIGRGHFRRRAAAAHRQPGADDRPHFRRRHRRAACLRQRAHGRAGHGRLPRRHRRTGHAGLGAVCVARRAEQRPCQRRPGAERRTHDRTIERRRLHAACRRHVRLHAHRRLLRHRHVHLPGPQRRGDRHGDHRAAQCRGCQRRTRDRQRRRWRQRRHQRGRKQQRRHHRRRQRRGRPRTELRDRRRCRRCEVHDQRHDRCTQLHHRTELRSADRCRRQQRL